MCALGFKPVKAYNVERDDKKSDGLILEQYVLITPQSASTFESSNTMAWREYLIVETSHDFSVFWIRFFVYHKDSLFVVARKELEYMIEAIYSKVVCIYVTPYESSYSFNTLM